jgi:hypothetical protein
MSPYESGFEPITSTERAILDKLLSLKFQGRDELIQQLDGLLSRKIDAEGSLQFHVTIDVMASVQSRVPTEARYLDSDDADQEGPHVNVLLHVVDGKLFDARNLQG